MRRTPTSPCSLCLLPRLARSSYIRHVIFLNVTCNLLNLRELIWELENLIRNVTMGRLKSDRKDGVLTMIDFVTASMMTPSSIKSGVNLMGDGRNILRIRYSWLLAPLI